MQSLCHSRTFLKGHLCQALPLTVKETNQKWRKQNNEIHLGPSLPSPARWLESGSCLLSVNLSSMRQVTGAIFLVYHLMQSG